MFYGATRMLKKRIEPILLDVEYRAKYEALSFRNESLSLVFSLEKGLEGSELDLSSNPSPKLCWSNGQGWSFVGAERI